MKPLHTLIASVCLVSSLFAVDFAVVNGEKVTMQDIQGVLKNAPEPKSFSQLTKQERTATINQAIQTKLIKQKAMDEGIQKSPVYKIALKKIEEKLLVEVWMKQQFENVKISKAQIQDYYKNNQKSFHQEYKVKARHIVVKTKKQAQNIIKALDNSTGDIQKAFIALAQEKSIGPSAPKGGDLGWFKEGAMLDAFWKEAMSLEQSEYSSAPIKTQYGFHVVFVDGKQKAYTIPLKQIEQTIESKLKMQIFQTNIQKQMNQLRQDADIRFK